MKPDSPSSDNANGEESNSPSVMNILASVINISADTDRDSDLDDEVMNFMHSHIHKQLVKLTTKSTCENNQGMMDGDTKAYFDEVIRGSALFDLMPDKDDDGDDDKENDSSFFCDQANDNEEIVREETQDNTAKFQLSRILLAKKVAEAFKITSDVNNDNDDDEGALPAGDSPASMSWSALLTKSTEIKNAKGGKTDGQRLHETGGNSGPPKRLEADLAGSVVSSWQQKATHSSTSKEVADAENAGSTMDGNGNRSRNPGQNSSDTPNDNSSASYEDARARLRKTQFDYATDSGQQRTAEATSQIDYRNVLKKKDKV